MTTNPESGSATPGPDADSTETTNPNGHDKAADISHLTDANEARETIDNILYMPISPRADDGGMGNCPPTHDAEAAEQPEDDGDGEEGDDVLDDEVYDELDAAADQHIEDFRKPTKPWPEPVHGEVLFAALVECFNRFMVLPPGSAEVLAAWAIMTYALHACDMRFAVRLIITAPGANSGKTTLLDLLAFLARRAEPTSEITPASFFRRANTKRTLLIDECDHNLPSRVGSRNPLVAMLNMGHKRTSAVVLRTETINKQKVTLPFPIFCAVAMAGIGSFAPDTIKSRSFTIKLKRKMAHEEIESFIAEQHAPMMRQLRAEIYRWVLDNREAIQHNQPTLDRELSNNRQRDNAMMLLQIADVLGKDCGARLREAIKTMTGDDHMDNNELLLGDIASILLGPQVMVDDPPKPIGEGKYVFSGDLCELIQQYFPYRESYQGFNEARLASMLKAFDLKPKHSIRRGKQVLNGYPREAFNEWFTRYGFESPEAEITEAEIGEGATDGSTPAVEPATPRHPVPGQEPTGSDVAPSTAPSEADDTPSASSHMADENVYPNAHVVEPGKGDKKRADALRCAVDAAVLAGSVDASEVVFCCSRFWIVRSHDALPSYAHLNGGGDLELLPIQAPGLIADNDAGIVVNPRNTLTMAESDYLILRPLVNKARKLLA